jgi:hypothetical protein
MRDIANGVRSAGSTPKKVSSALSHFALAIPLESKHPYSNALSPGDQPADGCLIILSPEVVEAEIVPGAVVGDVINRATS